MYDKDYELRLAHETIDLTGDWKYHLGAAMKPTKGQTFFVYKSGALFNGLLAPALNYTIKGVIGYQGESNCGKGQEYYGLFKDMIQDWRNYYYDQELPFLLVQLTGLGRENKQPVERGCAEVRDAQRCALELPNTGMAVTFDIGEWNDIHPQHKKEVAQRLFLNAEKIVYGDTSIVASGLLYQSMEVKDNSIILTFSSVGSEIVTKEVLDGFTIAGENGQYVWANAVVLSSNTVKVWSDYVVHPKAVRYGWADNPTYANLKNNEGLPASPFTTKSN